MKEPIKPEGKLTIITDFGDGTSKTVDGVSMDTVKKLICCGNCDHQVSSEDEYIENCWLCDDLVNWTMRELG